MRDGTAAARRIEQAAIERWFSSDALGYVFHAADGRAWPIDDRAAERARMQAARIVEAMFDAGRRDRIVLVASCVAVGLFAYLLPDTVRLATVSGLATMLFVALPFWSVLRGLVYRARLRRLRASVAKAMVGPVLIDADPLRRARTNLFRVAQHLWVLLALLGILALQLAPGQPFLLRLQAAGGIVTLVAIAVVMGVAWALYFAAEQIDRVQARHPECLSRVPWTARDSWSQAD